MIRLINFDISKGEEYIDMYKEWKESNTDLIPDILEIECGTTKEYVSVLDELNNRSNGLHADIDWYEKAYYFFCY